MNNEIFLKDDPGRKGGLTGKTRERSGHILHQVKWHDGDVGWLNDYEFEVLENVDMDAFSLLRSKNFGRINDLRRNLTFIHLSGRLANIVYSMDTTATDFYPYQFKPVLAFLEAPSNGILIADEVGLGKTIEAGLIWTELRARFDARRLVVVCPAMLREKWCDELRKKFGVDAIQLSANELLKELDKNKFEVPDGKGYVCSLQGIRPSSSWRDEDNNSASAQLARKIEKLTEVEPAIDLLIVDEAHYLRNPETQSAVIGRLLREISEYIVLLSATPVNNKERDLFSLLKLVDPDTFSVESVFPQVLRANEPLLRARRLTLDLNSNLDEIKEQLQLAADHSLLKGNRQLKGLLEREFSQDYLLERANRIELANRIEKINLLSHSVNRTRKVEVHELRVVREPFSQFVQLQENDLEANFYNIVTESIRKYAIQRRISEGFLLSPPQRQVSSCMYAAAKSWKEKTNMDDLYSLIYEDSGVDEIFNSNYSPLIDHISSEVLTNVNIEDLRIVDSKYQAFGRVVQNYLHEHTDEKIIVFSYFKGTLHYLNERLTKDGFECQLLYGGMSETKQDIIDRFRDDKKIQILLTSEVASEGVDLQFCRILINYDLPWNPMKIEQRIGRIDRIGQKSEKISIWNLGYANTIDERIYERLLNKLGIFERSLGGMEAILGDMINELTSDLLSRPLTQEQEKKRIDDTYIAVETIRQQQEELEANASHLIAHGGYIIEKVKAAHDFNKRIANQDIKLYIKDYLDKYCKGFEFLESNNDPMLVNVKLPPELAAKFDEFIRRNHLHGQSLLASGNKISCRFENKVQSSKRKEEYISQFHPFVRFVSSQLKDLNEEYYPLVAVKLDKDILSGVMPDIYAFSVKRWSFTGLRTEETIQARVISINTRKMLDSDASWELVNAVRVEGMDWLSAGSQLDVNAIENAFNYCDIQLDSDYKILKEDRINENTDRVSFQIESASRHRDRLLNVQKELLLRYQLTKNKRMIPPTEGKIRAIENKFQVQIEKYKQKSDMKTHSSDVVYGMMLVEYT